MSLKDIVEKAYCLGRGGFYIGMPMLIGENAICYGGLYRENWLYITSGAVALILGRIGFLQALTTEQLSEAFLKSKMFEYTPLPTVAITATLVSSLAPLEFIIDKIK